MIMKEVIRWLGECINQYQGNTPLDSLYDILAHLYYDWWIKL